MLQQWLGYDLTDLVIYSPRAYAALVTAYNQAIWPMQLLVVAVIAGIAVLLWQRRPAGYRTCMVLLAACWLWVAMAFFLKHYSALHWAASYMALAFTAQALWLLFMAVRPIFGATPWRTGLCARVMSTALFMTGIIAPVAIIVFQDKPWTQLEMPGLMPDPTAVITLGVLILIRRVSALPAVIVPLAWCLYSGALHIESFIV